MKISFVLPIYNRKDHIINALEALNYQNGCNECTYEVIVVDDGSDDDCCCAIKGIKKNYDLKYIYLDRSAKSCPSRARNYGWRNSHGDIIAFIDGDIIVPRNYIKEIERYYKAEQNLMLIGTRLMLKKLVALESIRDESVFKLYKYNGNDPELLENRHYLFDKYSYNISAIKKPWLKVYGCNIVMPRTWVEKIGGFDENFLGWGGDDLEMAYRAYTQGIKIYIDSKLEVLHQFHGEGDDVIRQDKFDGYEMNINYFYDKHPNAFELSRTKTHELSKGIIDIDYGVDEEKPEIRKVLDFKDRKDLPDIKESILKFSNEKRLEIVVNDYVEDTDLDIWVQALGKRKSTPKYVPISRKLSMI